PPSRLPGLPDTSLSIARHRDSSLFIQQRGGRGQMHSEARASARRALNFNAALMRANYLVADRKAKPCAAIASRARMVYAVESAEYAVLLFGRNSYPSVNYIGADGFALSLNA